MYDIASLTGIKESDDPIDYIDPSMQICLSPKLKYYSRDLGYDNESPFYKMGITYAPCANKIWVIYLSDLENSLMFEESNIEFLMYKCNGIFFMIIWRL